VRPVGAKGVTMKQKPISGTREWAAHNANLPQTGCEHDCRYCYARAMAVRFGRATADQWATPTAKPVQWSKFKKKYSGTVMFPTTHDITPNNIGECVSALRLLVESGNHVLIVSKPHIVCIERLFQALHMHRDNIMFRFTIGARDNDTLKYWEPGAPSYEERVACLVSAYRGCWRTSVSIEPMLDAPHDVIDLFHALAPWVTDSIWIGKMNNVAQRVRCHNASDQYMVADVLRSQNDERIKYIYNALKNEPKVRWKESIKKVVGLPLATEAGTDQ